MDETRIYSELEVMMYILKICIYTDGDFGYEDSEFHIESDVERVFYFKDRESAISAFLRHFHSVKNSLRTYGRDNIDRWFNRWDRHIELISKKVPTFKIEKCFGNQEVFYCLCEVSKAYLDNGAFYFKEKKLDTDFSIYYEEDIRWDMFETLEDVKVNDC